MPPALIAAGIGAAASIGGGLLASKSTKKAADKAADTSMQTANANNALTREIYDQNTANMTPFMQGGLRAQGVLGGMLYGDAPAQAPQAMQMPQQNALGPVQTYSDMAGDPNMYRHPALMRDMFPNAPNSALAHMPPGMFQPNFAAPQLGAVPQQPGAVTVPAPNAQSAWDQFRNSTNYQFRLGEGLRGLNQGYAARGMLQSGAALKGINNYAQNFASNEVGNYMNLLSQQQNMGMAGASALAGVGQNMVNNVTANNNSAGSAAANAALMAGQANASMYGGIANALGGLAGSFGSSFGKW